LVGSVNGRPISKLRRPRIPITLPPSWVHIVPLFSPEEFTDKGALLPSRALSHSGKLALVLLQNGAAAPTYVAGTSNFYAITRYNWSSYYALAVISLGEALRESRAQGR
jgi:membrane-bound lytic murein transglycosylase B